MVFRRRLTRALAWTFLAVAVYGVWCTGALAVERMFGGPRWLAAVVALVAAGIALWLALRGRRLVDRLAGGSSDALVQRPTVVVLAVCLAAGAALRVGWVLVVPPSPAADHLHYLEHAISLAAGEGYLADGRPSVYRPPGVSLLMAGPIALFGDGQWVITATDLALFTLTVLLVFELGRRIAGDAAARLAAVIVAAWPTTVLLTGFVSKELLQLLLLSLVVVLWIGGAGARSRGSGRAAAALAGLALGALVLTQPHHLLMLGCVAVYELLRGARLRDAAVRLALLGAGAVVVVAPWTVRNWRATGELVLVSANAGQSLWAGNNPAATGGYTPVRGSHRDLDEVTYNRLAGRWAVEWIRENPRRFLELAVRKQKLYLGDDADGAYESLKRAHGVGDLRYAVVKGLCNAFWIGILTLVAVATRRQLAEDRLRAEHGLLMLPLLVQLALFSVTESGGRHHISLAGPLAVLAALAVANGRGANVPVRARRQRNGTHRVVIPSEGRPHHFIPSERSESSDPTIERGARVPPHPAFVGRPFGSGPGGPRSG